MSGYRGDRNLHFTRAGQRDMLSIPSPRVNVRLLVRGMQRYLLISGGGILFQRAMVRALEYYSGIPLPRVERYCDQMEKEFGEIREKYGVDGPEYGRPLAPHHRRILDRFVKNIQVLRKEPSVKEQYASHPLRDYTLIARLERFEGEVHAFRATFPRVDSEDPEDGTR
jgi:hypothetical protein